jgi:ELWxxDGT repeat protein
MSRGVKRRQRKPCQRRFFPLRGEGLESRVLLTAMPQMVPDLNLAQAGIFVRGPIIEMGGLAYFSRGFGAGDYELWKTDGAAAGTVLVKDIKPGVAGSNPKNLANINGTLWFSANDGVNGTELWKSDGTVAGTVLVKDISAGIFPSNPANFRSAAGTIFFSSTDGTTGQELWKTDGTTNGTVQVKDIRAGLSGSSAREFTNFGGALYFSATDSNFDWPRLPARRLRVTSSRCRVRCPSLPTISCTAAS